MCVTIWCELQNEVELLTIAANAVEELHVPNIIN